MRQRKSEIQSFEENLRDFQGEWILLTHFSPCLTQIWGITFFLELIICSQLLYNPPFCLSSGLPQLKVYVCGLSLAEQSYYEKSNPSLGDRGVTQDLGDAERPDVCLGTQIQSSKRICATNRNNGASPQVQIFKNNNNTQTVSGIQLLLLKHLLQSDELNETSEMFKT